MTLSNTQAKILKIMQQKKTNLVVAADVTSSATLLELAKDVGPHILALKTHIDILDDFSSELILEIKNIAVANNFLLFEDRKFADIGNTTLLQLTNGVFNMSKWADLITVHTLPGPGILQSIEDVCLQNNIGVLLLLEMSSSGNLLSPQYQSASIDFIAKYHHIIAGVIAQKHNAKKYYCLKFTPGVSLNHTKDNLGQNYNTPQKAILENGSDIIIVGRDIVKSNNSQLAAQHYQKMCWDLYQQRENNTLIS